MLFAIFLCVTGLIFIVFWNASYSSYSDEDIQYLSFIHEVRYLLTGFGFLIAGMAVLIGLEMRWFLLLNIILGTMASIVGFLLLFLKQLDVLVLKVFPKSSNPRGIRLRAGGSFLVLGLVTMFVWFYLSL